MKTVHYDPLDPATLADPYPVYAALRESAPVLWHEAMRCWTVTRYQDCHGVLRDPQLFARDWRRVGTGVPDASLSVQSVDPPDQAPIRSLFMNALHAQDLAALELRTQDALTEIFRVLADSGEFDLLRDVAAPMSLYVISELLGVEQPELESFAAVSDAIMRSMDAGLLPSTIAPGRQAREQLSALVETWFQATDRPGLLADVMRHRATADVSELYVRNTTRVMFQGGYSTMVSAIGNVVHTLLRNPCVLEQLRDPALLHSGIEELVRFDGPVQGTSRVATRTTQISGVTVGEGQIVLVLFAAANHDPEQFPRPTELVLDRSPNPHLGFGWGPHSCMGTVPAQVALRALINSLLSWPLHLRAAGTAQRRQTATMRGLSTLPVTFRS